MMNLTLEESTTERVSPLLEELIKRILSQSKSFESLQKDIFFVLILVLMIENGFLPTNNVELLYPLQSIDLDQLSKWKSHTGAMEAIFVMSGFKSIPLKVIISPLGATVLLNVVINNLNSETYSICLPVSRYVVSPQASTIPMIFRDLKHLSNTVKNKILCTVKSRILSSCGYPSASLIGLPEEIFHKIMLYLPIVDVVNVSGTCRRLQGLIRNDSLWHELYKRDFNSTNLSERRDWKEIYKEKYILQKESKSCHSHECGGTMHDYMDYSDFVSYIDNPMWDVII